MIETEEITEPPRVEASVHRARDGRLRVNRALADRLHLVHRVAHRLLVADGDPVPVPLGREQKLLAAMFGSRTNDTPAVGPRAGKVVDVGARVARHGTLIEHL